MSLLKDKVAIVTGGGQGVGFAIAKRFAEAGAKLVLVGRTAAKLEHAAAQLLSTSVDVCPCDLLNPNSDEEILKHTRSKFGRVDILINCAAVFAWKPFLQLTLQDLQQTFDTNLIAPFRLTQAVAKQMVAQGGGGSIINISSIHGEVGDANVVAHCASKWGLNGFTVAVAEALREHNIRVNCVAPGSIAPNTPAQRGGITQPVTQQDVADAVTFLASEQASAITGSIWPVYGATRAQIKAK